MHFRWKTVSFFTFFEALCFIQICNSLIFTTPQIATPSLRIQSVETNLCITMVGNA